MSIILASASPRRRELLGRLGVRELTVLPADADETIPAGMEVSMAVRELSRRKALWAADRARPGDAVIAADTLVYLDGAVLGKPRDAQEAFSMLERLSGRGHEVYTGVTVIKDGALLCEAERTAVYFRSLSQAEIRAYVETGEPMDKAGAYGIQEFGALLVARVEGDFYNVMGLPLCRLYGMLSRVGVELLTGRQTG